MTQSLVLSGVQPTGNLHLGNYLGAIAQWVRMQHTMPCIFGIMNLHAITVPQNPDALRDSTLEVAAALIASGIDPARTIIFAQSDVSAHAELSWILNCHTPLGWLNRMTQFKEKAGKQRDNAVLGLYAYPVLMTADILAYRATHVPVGEDQKQHLELSRDIAGAFNRFVGNEYFTLPEPLILPTAARIMSLRDGTKKMSKSDPSDYSRINLTDNADTIALKLRKAKTDAHESVTYDEATRPEVANLLQIYTALAEQSLEQTTEHFAGKNNAALKNELADITVAKLAPIAQNMRALLADKPAIRALLNDGAARAEAIAAPVLREVKTLVGLA